MRCCATGRTPPSRKSARFSPAICAAAPATDRSCERHWRPHINCVRNAPMLDLGRSFVASVARDPEGLAIVDGATRLTYRAWYGKISALGAAFGELGLGPGDHLITVLQNRWEAASLHWACQLAGIIITPVNWRATGQEIDFCIADADARAIVYQDVSAQALAASKQARHLPRIAVAIPGSPDLDFARLVENKA